MKNTRILSALLLLIFVFASCEKKSEDGAPQLPPENSFIMDFSDFSQTKSGALDTVSFQNWTYAAANVAFWNIILSVNSVIPVAAFKESFNHDAEFTENNTWQWGYGVEVTSGDIYTARLTGQLLTDSVEWKMYIQKDGILGFDEVLWFEGRSATDNSGGWWLVNHNPASPEAYFRIDWSRASEEEGTLRYTLVEPDNEANGNYIEYGRHQPNDINFNAYYDIVDLAGDQTINIQWNRETKEGRVKKLNETTWSCWDAELHDTSCP